MLKLPTLIALFVCFVYSNNEHNVDTQSPLAESHIFEEQKKENKNTFHTIKGNYVEEKQKNKPCKGHKNRRLGDSDNKEKDLFDSSPLTAILENMDTANIGNKVVISSIQEANYNDNDKNTKTESDKNGLHSEKCDCDSCISEANKKVFQFETLERDGNNNPIKDPANDVQSDESKSADNSSMPLSKEAADEFASNEKHDIPRDNVSLDSDTGELTRPCNKTLSLNTRRRKCGRVKLTEIVSTSTRRILPGIIENPTKQELEENKLYQDSPQVSGNDEMESKQNWYDKLVSLSKTHNPTNEQSEDNKLLQDDPQINRQGDMDMENRQNYFPSVQKVSNTYGIDLVHNMNINEVPPTQDSPLEDSVESQLTEPTRGKGIYDMKDARVMLLENARVCYACSSMSDPTCWSPDRRTTVKYCKKGDHSCLVKSFKHKGKSVIIRDCGSHCINLPGSEEKYSSCSICHSDLCNSAASVSIYSTGFAIVISFGILLNMS